MYALWHAVSWPRRQREWREFEDAISLLARTTRNLMHCRIDDPRIVPQCERIIDFIRKFRTLRWIENEVADKQRAQTANRIGDECDRLEVTIQSIPLTSARQENAYSDQSAAPRNYCEAKTAASWSSTGAALSEVFGMLAESGYQKRVVIGDLSEAFFCRYFGRAKVETSPAPEPPFGRPIMLMEIRTDEECELLAIANESSVPLTILAEYQSLVAFHLGTLDNEPWTPL